MPPATKTTLISGIRGQEGSRLAELLLKAGHSGHGIKRRVNSYGRRPPSLTTRNGIFVSHEIRRRGEWGAGMSDKTLITANDRIFVADRGSMRL